MKRGPKTQRSEAMSLRITKEQLIALKGIAALRGCSVSSVASNAISDLIASWPTSKDKIALDERERKIERIVKIFNEVSK